MLNQLTGTKHIALGLFLGSTISMLPLDTAQGQLPDCVSIESDADGDGWGWENNASCVITTNIAVSVTNNNQQATCSELAIDPDNDGWGWENEQSCIITYKNAAETSNTEVTKTVFPTEESEPVIDTGTVEPESKPEPQYAANPSVADITDLIFVTGQSNLRASETGYDAQLDSVNSRVFAFNSDGEWNVADLHQAWDDGWYPGNGSSNDPTRQPYNNLAFHFAKNVAENSNRVVGIVVASAPGKGIAHWDANGGFFNQIRTTALAALNAQGARSAFNAVLWHQGETDWILNGTADPEASEFEKSYSNYYPEKLDQTINNFRLESWFENGPFICGETTRAPVNQHLRGLNSDNDDRTACVAGEDLPRLPADESDVHFSAAGLREIGRRYGLKYLEMTGG